MNLSNYTKWLMFGCVRVAQQMMWVISIIMKYVMTLDGVEAIS